MEFYTKKNRQTFEHWIDFLAVFGVFFLFANCVLYVFGGSSIHLFLSVAAIVLMALRLIKWYDD